MSDECIGEGLEDVGGEGPTLREGAQVEYHAVDVDGEVLPVLWSDRQRVKAVLHLEGHHPVVRLGDGPQSLQGLHLHGLDATVVVDCAEVDHESPSARLPNQKGARDPSRRGGCSSRKVACEPLGLSISESRLLVGREVPH